MSRPRAATSRPLHFNVATTSPQCCDHLPQLDGEQAATREQRAPTSWDAGWNALSSAEDGATPQYNMMDSSPQPAGAVAPTCWPHPATLLPAAATSRTPHFNVDSFHINKETL